MHTFCTNFVVITQLSFFSAKRCADQHSFQDARKYHGQVVLGTPAEKPPQRSTAWLQGTQYHYHDLSDHCLLGDE